MSMEKNIVVAVPAPASLNCTPWNSTHYEWGPWVNQGVFEKVLPLIFLFLGLLLNLFSLVIYIRLHRNKESKRNNMRIFFILLSLTEVLLNYSIIYFHVNDHIISNRKTYVALPSRRNILRPVKAVRFDDVTQAHLQVLTKIAHSVLSLSLLSLRNWWVALTTVFRSYVAAQRTQVSPKIYSTRRVVFMYLFALSLALGMDTALRFYQHHAFSSHYPMTFCNQDGAATSLLPRGGILRVSARTRLISRKLQVERFETYLIISTTFAQALPFLVILISTCVMIVSLKKNTFAGVTARNKRITRMVIIFAVIFFLLEVPRPVATALRYFLGKKGREIITKVVLSFSSLLQFTDSVANAVIYWLAEPCFRTEVLRIFGRSRERSQLGHVYVPVRQ